MRRAEPANPDQDLTPRRRRVLEAIEDSVRRNGYAPSMREIGEAAGLASTSAVFYQMSMLLEKQVGIPEPRAGQECGHEDGRSPDVY